MIFPLQQARALGIPIKEGIPEEVYNLMRMYPPDPLARDLECVSRETGIPFSSAQLHRFLRYAGLIRRWNPRAHLVSRRDLERLSWHFADAFLLLLLLPKGPQKLVDIGTGGGFPGIPLKILRPELQVHLVERSRKKAIFLREVVRELRLLEVVIHLSSFEDLHLDADIGVAKAVGGWGQLSRHLPHLLKEGGLFLRVVGQEANPSVVQVPHPLRPYPLRVVCYRVSRETIVPIHCPRL